MMRKINWRESFEGKVELLIPFSHNITKYNSIFKWNLIWLIISLCSISNTKYNIRVDSRFLLKFHFNLLITSCGQGCKRYWNVRSNNQVPIYPFLSKHPDTLNRQPTIERNFLKNNLCMVISCTCSFPLHLLLMSHALDIAVDSDIFHFVTTLTLLGQLPNLTWNNLSKATVKMRRNALKGRCRFFSNIIQILKVIGDWISLQNSYDIPTKFFLKV